MPSYQVQVLDQSGNPVTGAYVSASGVKDSHGAWITGQQGSVTGNGVTDSTGVVTLFALPNNPFGGQDTWHIDGTAFANGMTNGKFHDDTGQITGPIIHTITVTIVTKSGSSQPGGSPFINPPPLNAPAWIGEAALVAGLVAVPAVIGYGLYKHHQKVKSQGAQPLPDRVLHYAKYAALL